MFCVTQLHSLELNVADIDNLGDLPLETINNFVTHYSDVEKLLLKDFQEAVEQTLVALKIDVKDPQQGTATFLATARAMVHALNFAIAWANRPPWQSPDNKTYKTLHSDWSLLRKNAIHIIDGTIYNFTPHTCPPNSKIEKQLQTYLYGHYLDWHLTDTNFGISILDNLNNTLAKFASYSTLHSNEISKLGVIVSLRMLPSIFVETFKNAYDAAFNLLTDDTIKNSNEIINIIHNHCLEQVNESGVNLYLELILYIFLPHAHDTKSARKGAG